MFFSIVAVLFLGSGLAYLAALAVAGWLEGRGDPNPSRAQDTARQVSRVAFVMLLGSVLAGVAGVYLEQAGSDTSTTAPTANSVTAADTIVEARPPLADLHTWATTTQPGALAVRNTASTVARLEACAEGTYSDGGNGMVEANQPTLALNPDARLQTPKAPLSDLQARWLLAANNAWRILNWCTWDAVRLPSLVEHPSDPDAARQWYLIDFGVPAEELASIEDTITELEAILVELDRFEP